MVLNCKIIFSKDLKYLGIFYDKRTMVILVCAGLLRPSQPKKWVMLSTVSLPSHTFTGQLSPLSR